MKYIKTYEASTDRDKKKPHLNDFVIVEVRYLGSNEDMIAYTNFVNTHIGKIIKMKQAQFLNEVSEIYVKYNNITPEVKEWFNMYYKDKYGEQKSSGWKLFSVEKIKALATTKKALELKIQTDKYNL